MARNAQIRICLPPALIAQATKNEMQKLRCAHSGCRAVLDNGKAPVGESVSIIQQPKGDLTQVALKNDAWE